MKRKKERKEEKIPPLNFPDVPSEFPKYESNLEKEHKKIKEAVTPEEFRPQDLGIPIRKTMPEINPHPSPMEEPTAREKTLFIKLEQYKQAVKLLDEVKFKIEESQRILDKLKEIKNEEETELDSWQANLEKIKDDLLGIDTKLFEE